MHPALPSSPNNCKLIINTKKTPQKPTSTFGGLLLWVIYKLESVNYACFYTMTFGFSVGVTVFGIVVA